MEHEMFIMIVAICQVLFFGMFLIQHTDIQISSARAARFSAWTALARMKLPNASMTLGKTVTSSVAETCHISDLVVCTVCSSLKAIHLIFNLTLYKKWSEFHSNDSICHWGHSLGSDVSDHFFWSEYRVNGTRVHSLSSEFSLYLS